MLATRLRRALVGMGVFALAVAGLTSCDPVPTTSPLAMSLTDDGAIVEICRDDGLRDYFMEFRRTPSAPWETVFNAEGGPVFRVDTANPDPLLDVTVSQPFDAVGSSIVAVVFSSAGRPADVVYEAEFRIPASGLADGAWLHADGTVGPRACSDGRSTT